MAEPKPGHYFEGVLQLRDPTEEVLDFVDKEIASTKGKVHIAKAKELKNGVDLYLSSQRYMRALGKKLQERFGGIFKVTRKLFTLSKITSKNVYRVTVLFRMLPFKKGDIIKYQGQEWKVLSIDAQVRLQDPQTGEKKRVKTEDLARGTS